MFSLSNPASASPCALWLDSERLSRKRSVVKYTSASCTLETPSLIRARNRNSVSFVDWRVSNDKPPVELRFHARLTEGASDVQLVVF